MMVSHKCKNQNTAHHPTYLENKVHYLDLVRVTELRVRKVAQDGENSAKITLLTISECD